MLAGRRVLSKAIALRHRSMDTPSHHSCASWTRCVPTAAARPNASGSAVPAERQRLRVLLKTECVTNAAVRAQEDPYDDLYVEKVVFHGGPRLVLQGLTDHSAHTAQVILEAIFGPHGGLPGSYVRQAGRLAQTVLSLSNAISHGQPRIPLPP